MAHTRFALAAGMVVGWQRLAMAVIGYWQLTGDKAANAGIESGRQQGVPQIQSPLKAFKPRDSFSERFGELQSLNDQKVRDGTGQNR